MTTCKFVLVSCPKECKTANGVSACYMRKDIDEHLMIHCPNRDHKCEYCQEEGTYAYISQVHYCLPKRLAEIIFYQNFAKLLGAVILALVLGIILAKRDFNSEVLKYESEISSLKSNLHLPERVLNSTGSTVFQVTRSQQGVFSSKSPSFYTGSGGYHMAIQVNTTSGKDSLDIVSVYAVLLKGKYDDELSWPFVGKVAITLLNQLRDSSHKTKILTTVTDARVGDKWGFQQFIRYSALAQDPVKDTPVYVEYLKENTLYFRVSVEVSDHKPWLDCTI